MYIEMDYVSLVHFLVRSATDRTSGQQRNSSTLVPGDIVSLVDPILHIFPADMFLLSGDAIVNESMLTGESVPVGKAPIKDAELAKWKDNSIITSENAKGFLYAGTRVVRVRGALLPDGSTGGPALAIVARTGIVTPSLA